MSESPIRVEPTPQDEGDVQAHIRFFDTPADSDDDGDVQAHIRFQ